MLQAGVKAFERDDSRGVGCGYRVAQDGVHAVLPHLGRRVVRTTPRALGALLRKRSWDLGDDDAGPGAELGAEVATEVAVLRADLSTLQPSGCCVVLADAAADAGGRLLCAAIAVMKYEGKAVPFVAEGERQQLLDEIELVSLARHQF